VNRVLCLWQSSDYPASHVQVKKKSIFTERQLWAIHLKPRVIPEATTTDDLIISKKWLELEPESRTWDCYKKDKRYIFSNKDINAPREEENRQ
jgi:hypothetical protein